MKTILIATDFSESSQNATEYGIALANVLEAGVVLLNVYSPMIPISDTVVYISDEEMKANSELLLQEASEKIQTKLNGTLEILAEGGEASQCIVDVARKVNAAWIVCGMKSDHKLLRKIFGSTVLSLVHKSHIPLIIVPEDVKFILPKSILLASAITFETDLLIFEPLAELISHVKAQLHILRVITKDMDEVVERLSLPTRIKNHFERLSLSFEFVRDNNVTHALQNFIKEKSIDILTMIAKEHSLIERFFAKSNIKEMLFNCSIPIFILPDISYAAIINDK